MIDEKKLIEYLETLTEFECKKSQESAEIGAFDMATCYGHGEYCYKNAINAAEEQPKIGGWIPCSERLPEESLCSVIGWDEYRKRCCFVQYLGGRWILGNDIESVKITHWQPVPTAPYEVKSDE